jgi:WD40 repeat protein
LVRAVAFALDGHTLATAGVDGTMSLWDTTNPAAPDQVGSLLADGTRSVSALAFAPDGHTLATAGDDGTALWDTTDPAAPHRIGSPLTGHTGRVTAVAFAPDGHTLATAGDDGTVVLWDLTGLERLRAHPMERACSITGGGLDRTEWARYVPGLPYVDVCKT